MSNDSNATTEALRSQLAADPLWEFALDFYGRPDVEPACLLLQDEAGVDVCELLWYCWLHHHGLQLEQEPQELTSLRHWQQEITQPLRSLRRRLKSAAASDSGIAELRRTIQQAELLAERETLTHLQRLTEWEALLTTLQKSTTSLEYSLAKRWNLQKKTYVSAVQTLEYRLDPH